MLTPITGSSAAGQVFPPHLQFHLKVKSADTARIDANVVEHIQWMCGKFGCKEKKLWPITFGINKKGVMDNKEFSKYMWGAIAPLFPAALD